MEGEEDAEGEDDVDGGGGCGGGRPQRTECAEDVEGSMGIT